MAVSAVYRELGEAAWAWVAGQVWDEDGPWLPAVVPDDRGPVEPGEDRDSLYAGIGGLAPVLAELGQHRALSGAEQALAAGIVARLSARAPARAEPSLYDGLGGDVTALKLLAPGSERVALGRLAELMTPAGWPTTLEIEPGSAAPVTDLVGGAAGVVLAAVWAGGEQAQQVAATGGGWLLQAADRTGDGLDWGTRPGRPARMPNYSHGTGGIAAALAVAGMALGREDFIAAAFDSHLRCPAAASPGFLGQRRPLLRHRGRGRRPARRRARLHGPRGSPHLAAGRPHHGRRPR